MMTTLEVGCLCSLMPNNLEISNTAFRTLVPAEIAITTFRILAPAKIAIAAFITLTPMEIVAHLCLEGDFCVFVSILRPFNNEENEGTPNV